MKVLILGGTGAIGTHLVNQLQFDSSVQITVTSRKILKSSKVKYIQVDAKNLIFVNNLLNNSWDVIIDFMSYTTDQFGERHKKLCLSTKHYIFLSSSRVYSNSDEDIHENSIRLLDNSGDNLYLKSDEYALSKARQENLLFNSKLKNWTIVRPYITYGEMRLQLGVLEKEQWLYRAIKGRKIIFSEEMIDKITTLTYAKDVSICIKNIIGKEHAKNQIFNTVNNESIKWKEVLEIYLSEIESNLGFKPRVLFQKNHEFIRWNKSKYQIIYDRLYNRAFKNSKIKKHVDLNKFTKTHDGLSKSLKEFFKTPNFNFIDWKEEARKDRISGEYASLSEIKLFKHKVKYIIYRYIF